MATTGNARQYAKHRGVSAVAVSVALKEGRIKAVSHDGRNYVLDFEQCDRDWVKNRNPANSASQAEAARNPDKQGPVEPPTPPIKDEADKAEPEVSEMNFNQARTRRERFQAELARLEFEEKSGMLISAEKVRAQQFTLARNVREALLNIPNRIAPSMVGLSTLHEARMILTKEIHAALTSLADET